VLVLLSILRTVLLQGSLAKGFPVRELADLQADGFRFGTLACLFKSGASLSQGTPEVSVFLGGGGFDFF
jgi:hypothetical protein